MHRVPIGLEDVSKYPDLFVELFRLGWTEEELEKLAGGNLLRVMRSVEKVSLYFAAYPLFYWSISKLQKNVAHKTTCLEF